MRLEAEDGSGEFGGSVIGTEASDAALACFHRALQMLEEDGNHGGDGLSGTLDHAIDVAIRTIDPSYSFQKLGDYLAAVTGQEAGVINLRPEYLHKIAKAQLQEIGMADVVDSLGMGIGVDLGMSSTTDGDEEDGKKSLPSKTTSVTDSNEKCTTAGAKKSTDQKSDVSTDSAADKIPTSDKEDPDSWTIW